VWSLRWTNVTGYCLAPPFNFFWKPQRHHDNAIVETDWKRWQNRKWVGWKSNCVLVLPFLFWGVQTSVWGAKPPEAPCGDVIGGINPLTHLAPLVSSVLLDILQQVSNGYLPSWSSSVLGWPFWELSWFYLAIIKLAQQLN